MAEGRRTAYDTHCCIVGGGPAGMILALLLGRAGVPTTLLEEHEDFERDFRGDTVHPSTMELMDSARPRRPAAPDAARQDSSAQPRFACGLDRDGEPGAPADEVPLHHDDAAGALSGVPGAGDGEPAVGAAGDAGERPGAPLGGSAGGSGVADRAADAHAAADGQGSHPAGAAGAAGPRRAASSGEHSTLPDDAVVRGVRYRSTDGWHDVRAPLVVGADGRFSRVRRLAGLELIEGAAPMDIMWFRLPRRPDESEAARGKIGQAAT